MQPIGREPAPNERAHGLREVRFDALGPRKPKRPSVVLGRTDELSIQPALAYAAPAVGIALFVAALWFWRHELPLYKSTGH